MLPRPCGAIALLSDFGGSDPSVGMLKGSLLRHAPRAHIVDLTHDVEPRDVGLGAFYLWAAAGRFPSGTVFLALVDCAGSAQARTLCAVAHECYWVGPDNGVHGEAVADVHAELRAVDFAPLGFGAATRSFAQRDARAAFAASLSAGRFGFSAAGPRCADPVRVPPLLAGGYRVVHVDAHGNLVTNIPATAIAAARAVAAGGRSIPFRGSPSEVSRGHLAAFVNSYDLVEIAENHGSAAASLRLSRGSAVALEPASL